MRRIKLPLPSNRPPLGAYPRYYLKELHDLGVAAIKCSGAHTIAPNLNTALKESLHGRHNAVEKVHPERHVVKIFHVRAWELAPQASLYGVAVDVSFPQVELVYEPGRNIVFAPGRHSERNGVV